MLAAGLGILWADTKVDYDYRFLALSHVLVDQGRD